MVVEEITFYTQTSGQILYGETMCSFVNKNGKLWLKAKLPEEITLNGEIHEVEFLGITLDLKVAFICDNHFIGQIKNFDSYAYSKNI